MREIKFRGKDDNGHWHFGDLRTSEHFPPQIVEGGLYTRFFFVDSATVGQFTGLCDSEGREIYEGDVVRHKNCICLVVYNSTRFASFALRKDGWAYHHYFGEAFEASECQVIGNVHDDLELLNETHPAD